MDRIKLIKTWKELAELLESSARQRWIFRGESWEPGKENDRKLAPKAGRVSSDIGSARKVEYRPRDEIKALELFKRQAHPYLSHQPRMDIEWLSIAQHHGMSTRLLDWTESLLVAAYFAVKDAGAKGKIGVIFGVPGLPVASRSDEKNPFAVKHVKVYRPPHIAVRIPAQRSVFTLHPSPTSNFKPDDMRVWKIESAVCGSIKVILDSCAINEASLFPDLDGLSRYVGWRYKWGNL